jgi:hypothetical protein
MDHDTQPQDEDRDPNASGDAPQADGPEREGKEREGKERETDEAAPDATVPFDPEEDDESALGDTDQHSSA